MKNTNEKLDTDEKPISQGWKTDESRMKNRWVKAEKPMSQGWKTDELDTDEKPTLIKNRWVKDVKTPMKNWTTNTLKEN